MQFVVRNHRQRTKLTLTAQHSEGVSASITLSLAGQRVLTISDRLVAKYRDSITDYIADGALVPIGALPEA